MSRPEILLVVYCLLIIASSVAGGRLPRLMQMTHLRTQLLMSGVGGLMLGIAMLHLLPHATEILRSSAKSGAAALIGLIGMFLVIRIFHTHSHDVISEPGDGGGHDHDHHDHAGGEQQDDSDRLRERGIGWMGMFFGLAMHTLIDGVALASSVIADSQHTVWLGLAGLGTFLAVALHKPLDAFAITSVMKRQGWSTSAQNLANLLFSLACPLGAAGVYFGAKVLFVDGQFLGWGLAISAGFFICIALADLLPEVAFHNHDRGKLTAALLLGVAIAFGLENLPGHEHQVDTPAVHDHDHDHNHDHNHDH